MDNPVRLLGLVVIVLMTTAVLVDVIRRWAVRRRIVDIPNVRSSHEQATPRGGGLAIIAGVALGTVGYVGLAPTESARPLLVYALGGLAVAWVSWVDDLRSVSPMSRLAVHVGVSVLVVLALGGWDRVHLPGIGDVTLGGTGPVLTVLWIVGLINAYNFMDGIDGLAAGVGVTAGIGWSLIALKWAPGMIVAVGLFAGVACLGFLRRNWPPASVFMGDVGSAYLGYTFALLPVLFATTTPDQSGLSPMLGVLVVWPFVFDTVFTFGGRILKREPIFHPHKTHLYQRLVVAGWSHRTVSMLYVALGMTGLMFGWLWMTDPDRYGFVIVGGVILFAALLWVFVRVAEVASSK